MLRDDKLIEVYELQRTYRNLKLLKQKTQDVSEICSIKWVFFAGAYRQMGEQRDWLSSVGMHYFKLSFENYRLILEDGSPPIRRNQDRNLHSSPKSPQGDGCIHRENFGPDANDSLRVAQILGIDFRGAAQPDLHKKNSDTAFKSNKHLPKSGRLKFNEVDSSSNSEQADRNVLAQSKQDLLAKQDDSEGYSRFFVGCKISIGNDIWTITAVSFIADKALLRLGPNTRWYSFAELDSLNR